MVGTEGFQAGLFHPLTTPSHLLVLLALALLGAQRASSRSGLAALVFGAFLAGGLVLALSEAVEIAPWTISALSTAGGLLVASRYPVAKLCVLLLYATAALVIGLDSAVEIAKTKLSVLCGTWIGAVGLVFTVSFYGASLPKKQWSRIAVRVLGSWIATAGLLTLALALRGRP